MAKGRTGLVELFEPVAFREDVSDQLRECISVFEAGLGRWRDRDWDGAFSTLRRALDLSATSPEHHLRSKSIHPRSI